MMKINDMQDNHKENEQDDQPELEKLLEQKQSETEALKRLINGLGKLEPGGKKSPKKGRTDG